MVGIIKRVFGRSRSQEVKTKPMNGNRHFKPFLSLKNLKQLIGFRAHKSSSEKHANNVKHEFSEDVMTRDHELRYLGKQQAEDGKQILGKENIKGKTKAETDLPTASIFATPIVRKCPSSTQLLNRPWLIKVQNHGKGEPPTLKCYSVDEEGNLIQVEGKPALIPPTLNPDDASVEPWKPKHWKPIRQTLQLHEITPSPKCPKHQHLQQSKRYELTRKTLLQATIFTTKQGRRKGVQTPTPLVKESKKPSTPTQHPQASINLEEENPQWVPPTWEPLKDNVHAKDESNSRRSSSSGRSNSNSVESEHESESHSSGEKEGNLSDSFKEKRKLEEEAEKLKEKRLEAKRKKRELKKKMRVEKQRQWRLAIREDVAKNAFAGTYGATRAGGGRLF